MFPARQRNTPARRAPCPDGAGKAAFFLFSAAVRFTFMLSCLKLNSSIAWKGGDGTLTIGEAVRERILELCRERDITVNRLCTLSGVTQSTVNNLVSGRNRSVTISTIKKLCDGLDITIQVFFDSPLFQQLEQEIQ